jgi:hypothetical protein
VLSSGAEASRCSRRRVWECPGGGSRACGGAVVVLVLVLRREGDWWWEVVESVSVGWQSARECCGLWEETGGGSDGAQRDRAGFGRGRSKPDSQPASQQAKRCAKEWRRKAGQATSRGERTSNARQQPFATSTSVWGNRRLVCESVPDDLPFAE